MKTYIWKIVVGAFLITMLATLVLVPQARAQGVIYGDTVPAGETVEKNILLVGDRISIAGNVDGDVIAVGTNITVDGDISGSLIAAGQTIALNGEVKGSTYAGSLTLDLREAALQVRDLYFLGGQLIMQPGSMISRDLFAVSLGATLGGSVGRDLQAIIGPLEILNAIFQMTQGKSLLGGLPTGNSVHLADNSLALESSLLGRSVGKQFVSWRHAQYSTGEMISTRAANHGLTRPESSPLQQIQPQTRIDTQRLAEWLLARLRYWVTLLIFGGLALLLFPRWFGPWVLRARSSLLPGFAWGLVVLVFGFSAAFLIALLILPIALLFFALTLSDVGVTWLAAGYFSLGLSFTIFLIFVLYISKAVVAYLVGMLILERLAPRSMRYRFLPLLLGTFIYILVVTIPIIGWVIGLLATLLGLGAIWMTFQNRRLVIEEPLPAVAPDSIE